MVTCVVSLHAVNQPLGHIHMCVSSAPVTLASLEVMSLFVVVVPELCHVAIAIGVVAVVPYLIFHLGM